MLGNTDKVNYSIADTCGRRVLGMNGSLTSYINTGKAYKYKNDSFTKTQKTETKSKNKNEVLKNAAMVGLGALGILLAYKGGAKALNVVKDKASALISKLPKIDVIGGIKKIFKK